MSNLLFDRETIKSTMSGPLMEGKVYDSLYFLKTEPDKIEFGLNPLMCNKAVAIIESDRICIRYLKDMHIDICMYPDEKKESAVCDKEAGIIEISQTVSRKSPKETFKTVYDLLSILEMSESVSYEISKEKREGMFCYDIYVKQKHTYVFYEKTIANLRFHMNCDRNGVPNSEVTRYKKIKVEVYNQLMGRVGRSLRKLGTRQLCLERKETDDGYLLRLNGPNGDFYITASCTADFCEKVCIHCRGEKFSFYSSDKRKSLKKKEAEEETVFSLLLSEDNESEIRETIESVTMILSKATHMVHIRSVEAEGKACPSFRHDYYIKQEEEQKSIESFGNVTFHINSDCDEFWKLSESKETKTEKTDDGKEKNNPYNYGTIRAGLIEPLQMSSISKYLTYEYVEKEEVNELYLNGRFGDFFVTAGKEKVSVCFKDQCFTLRNREGKLTEEEKDSEIRISENLKEKAPDEVMHLMFEIIRLAAGASTVACIKAMNEDLYNVYMEKDNSERYIKKLENVIFHVNDESYVPEGKKVSRRPGNRNQDAEFLSDDPGLRESYEFSILRDYVLNPLQLSKSSKYLHYDWNRADGLLLEGEWGDIAVDFKPLFNGMFWGNKTFDFFAEEEFMKTSSIEINEDIVFNNILDPRHPEKAIKTVIKVIEMLTGAEAISYIHSEIIKKEKYSEYFNYDVYVKNRHISPCRKTIENVTFHVNQDWAE